jgi:hypothetical protein
MEHNVPSPRKIGLLSQARASSSTANATVDDQYLDTLKKKIEALLALEDSLVIIDPNTEESRYKSNVDAINEDKVKVRQHVNDVMPRLAIAENLSGHEWNWTHEERRSIREVRGLFEKILANPESPGEVGSKLSQSKEMINFAKIFTPKDSGNVRGDLRTEDVADLEDSNDASENRLDNDPKGQHMSTVVYSAKLGCKGWEPKNRRERDPFAKGTAFIELPV